MSKIHAVSMDRFGKRRWRKAADYQFAANEALCVLTMQELPKAHVDMPIGFVRSEDGYSLVAVMGLHPEINLFVDNNGTWLGRYIPAQLRGYPFLLARNSAKVDELTLCFEEESGLLSDDSDASPFFDAHGELSADTQHMLKFLEAVYKNRMATLLVSNLLAKHDLIHPWKLQINYEKGPHSVEGLFGIDEEALNSLSNEAFLELRSHGALPMTYCLLLSMQNTARLIARENALSKFQTDMTLQELDLADFTNDDGNISFHNL